MPGDVITNLETGDARALGARVDSSILGTEGPLIVREPTFGLIEAMRLCYQERGPLVGIMFIATLVAFLVAFTATPIYRAESLLAPVVSQRSDGISGLLGQLGGLGSLVEGYLPGGNRDQTVESVATLRSRSLALDFIRQHDLKRYFFPHKWDKDSQQWHMSEKVPTDLDAFEIFDRRVRSVSVDRRTGLVSLAIEWEDPMLAAKWANDLVQQVNERRRREAVREAKQSIEYLEAQAAKTSSVEALQAIYRLIEAHTKTMAVASAREEYAFRIIDRAVPPEKRVRPRRLIIVAFGMIGGLMLAIIIIVIRHGIRQRDAHRYMRDKRL